MIVYYRWISFVTKVSIVEKLIGVGVVVEVEVVVEGGIVKIIQFNLYNI